jgi:fatty acid-binding protein DegV
MVSVGKEKGRVKAMERLVHYVDELGEDIKDHRVLIGHTDSRDIAEEIEKEMVAIRAAHPNMISSLLRYPQLTATSFFSDITRLTEVPEF